MTKANNISPQWLPMRSGVKAADFGFLVSFLRTDDPRPAREQIDERYVGGWCDFEGFTLTIDLAGATLNYPGEPPMHGIAFCSFRKERVILFEHDWVAIVQLDGSFKVARLD